MKYLIFVLLLVAFLITAGCTSGNQNVVVTPKQTSTPSQPIVTLEPIQTTALPTPTIHKYPLAGDYCGDTTDPSTVMCFQLSPSNSSKFWRQYGRAYSTLPSLGNYSTLPNGRVIINIPFDYIPKGWNTGGKDSPYPDFLVCVPVDSDGSLSCNTKLSFWRATLEDKPIPI